MTTAWLRAIAADQERGLREPFVEEALKHTIRYSDARPAES